MKVILLFLLNIADLLFTLLWVNAGVGEEINPLMRFFLDMGQGYFIAVKLILTSIGCYAFWCMRFDPYSRLPLNIITGLYFLLFLYHLAIGAVVITYELSK